MSSCRGVPFTDVATNRWNKLGWLASIFKSDNFLPVEYFAVTGKECICRIETKKFLLLLKVLRSSPRRHESRPPKYFFENRYLHQLVLIAGCPKSKRTEAGGGKR